ncbi:MAG: hypothetical protein IJ695_03510 [Butyrivibrio sp.]|nr:hypothetical protein [Butyrivibrio sp.]
MSNNNENLNLLSDDELTGVSGGAGKIIPKGTRRNIMRVACVNCNRPFFADMDKTETKCPYCSKNNTFEG